jgi:exopolysaccharide production protein ExoZ
MGMSGGAIPQNGYLQQLRGVAALMVLLFHAALAMEKIRGSSALTQIFDFRFGLYGVCFFFALSGYLMAGAIRRQGSSHFLAARALRIYPMFFLTAGLTVLLYAIFFGSVSVHPVGWLLMPYTPRGMEALGVEWTLVFEMTFYVVLFVIAAAGLRSFIPALAALWTGAIVAAGIAWWPLQEWAIAWPVYEMLLVLPSLGFAGGLLIEHLKPPPPVGVAVAACTAAMAAHGYLDRMTNTSRYLAGACAVILVASLGARDRVVPSGGIGRNLNMAAEKLGDWSYALYLCHLPICILLYTQLPAHVPASLAFSMVLIVSITVAALLGTLDVRLYQKVKSALRATPSAPVKVMSGLYLTAFICFSTVTAYDYRMNEIDIANAAKLAPTLLPVMRDDATLVGHLESLQLTEEKALTAKGWAFDRTAPQRPLFIAVALDRSIAIVRRPTSERPDVSKDYKLDRTAAPSGFSVTTALCAADVVVFAFAMDGRAATLPHPYTVECSNATHAKTAER